MIYQGSARYPVREVVLHTADLPTGWATGKTTQQILDAFWRWHVTENGWRKIGYHRLFLPDGTMLYNTRFLRSLWEIGAHVIENNRGTIGLCMLNIRKHHGITRFEDYFTEDQRASVRDYIKELCAMTDIRKVSGHNDYAPKECPGFKVHTEDWLGVW